MNVPVFSVKEWDGHQLNCIIHGSIEAVLEKMQCRPRIAFTSPPYGVGKVTSVSSPTKMYLPRELRFRYYEYDTHNDESIPEETYKKWLDALCEKAGLVFWNTPAKQFERAFGVEPTKAIGQIIWDKPNAVPFPKNKIIYFHEFIWVFGDKNLFISSVKSVWTATTVQKSKHPAPFPIDLPGRAIDACTNKGDLVFDPFGGSGTTAAVAKALGRNFLTCDISRQYCDWMKERIEKTKIV